MGPGFERLNELALSEGPVLGILVGPNGAGKSSLYDRHLKGLSLPFINADIIARTLVDAGAPTGEETERLAAGLAERRRNEMVNRKESFITETVFSDPVGAKVGVLRAAQAVGYTVILLFVCVESAELCILRVQTRVQAGGHDVPIDKIAARYERLRRNVKEALTFVDLAILVDNSALDRPLHPVAAVAGGQIIGKELPLPWWAVEVLSGLNEKLGPV